VGESIAPDEGDHLATGWEPDLDVAATLVRQAVFLHASWPEAVATATPGSPGLRVDGLRRGRALVGVAAPGHLADQLTVSRPRTARASRTAS